MYHHNSIRQKIYLNMAKLLGTAQADEFSYSVVHEALHHLLRTGGITFQEVRNAQRVLSSAFPMQSLDVYTNYAQQF